MHLVSCELQLETPQMSLEMNREYRLRSLLGADWTERDINRRPFRTRLGHMFRNQRTHADTHASTRSAKHPEDREQAMGA